ncbi:hypothetical protein RI065_06000 [Mycoplasmatota bacterium zrk1]
MRYKIFTAEDSLLIDISGSTIVGASLVDYFYFNTKLKMLMT